MSFILTPLHIAAQREWSDQTFGPGSRLKGVIDHIKKELKEVKRAPHDVEEWADLLILVIDGATREGHTGNELIEAYHKKMEKNRHRLWPNWRTARTNKAIEHISNKDKIALAQTTAGRISYRSDGA